MVSVRKAVLADIPYLVEMGRALHAESPRYSRLRYSPEKVEETIRNMITSTLVTDAPGGALVAVKAGRIIGMHGGYITAPFFSYDKIATDYTFYVVPEQRRRGKAAVALVRAFEAWAEEQGAVDIVPGISTMIGVDSTVSFYKKLGYELHGAVMLKRIR